MSKFMIDQDFEDIEYKKSQVVTGIDVPKAKDKLIKNINANNLSEVKQSFNEKGLKGLLINQLPSLEVKPISKSMLRLLLEQLDKDSDLKLWDVSDIKDMSMLFNELKFSHKISEWDVSNVENMCLMFYNSNIDLEAAGIKNWNVSKVRNMRWMMEETDKNKAIVQVWKKQGLLHKEIDENDIFYPKQKH